LWVRRRHLGAGLTVLVALAASSAHAGPWIEATVAAITDGDTLWAEIADPGQGLVSREKVRLVGIDCPEQGQAPWGPRATARLSALVLGASVQIEVPLQSRDRYGRLLGAIWRDDQLVQEQLVREGLCVPYTVPPNVEHVNRIRAASEHARRDGIGIYAPAGPLLESPREYRRRRVGADPPESMLP
jgi:micrococcal nuclease